MIAPLIPTVKNNTDLSNFDEYPSERDDTPEETSGWDEDFWLACSIHKRS